MTVAQELVKEPCKSNPKGLKCTKKLRRILQSEMKAIPAIKRRAAINKRLKEIKSSSTTVVRGKARRKLKRSYAGNLPQPGQVRGAVAPAANPAAPAAISQPFGQLRPDFERANTDRLNAAANAGDRVQSAYYAQQLGLTPSIRNNSLNTAALALFPPATTNFQAQPLVPGAGVPAAPAPTIASINAANQARLLQQQPLPPAAPPVISQSAGGMGTPRGGGKPFPRPNIPPSGPPPGSVGFGTRTSGPLNAQDMRGVSNVQPGQQLSLKKSVSFSRNPRPEGKGDVENRNQAAGMGGVGRGERKKTQTTKKKEEAQRLAEAKSSKKTRPPAVRKTPTPAGPRARSERGTPALVMSAEEASDYNKSIWNRKGSSKDENASIKKRIGKALFGGKYTKLKRGEVGKRSSPF